MQFDLFGDLSVHRKYSSRSKVMNFGTLHRKLSELLKWMLKFMEQALVDFAMRLWTSGFEI